MALHSWWRRIIVQWLFVCLFAACSSGQAGNVSYNVEVRGEGNQVSILHNGGESLTNVVQVTSARGIGQAIVVWWGAIPPHPLEFQVHTNGLEKFSLQWGSQAVKVSVNSTNQAVTE